MAPHESTLVSCQVLARRPVSTVQVTDVSPRDGLQNETAQASTAAAAQQPTTGDDGTALGLQYFPACGRVQAFGHVKELAGVQGADQMPLLGEPEIPVDGAPSRLPRGTLVMRAQLPRCFGIFTGAIGPAAPEVGVGKSSSRQLEAAGQLVP
ncbi:unnamed protein product [Effrenium voratum]|nr:unnamed protein product [Effrenium voratum]